MQFTGEIIGISSSRGKKVAKIALSPNVSMDELERYGGQLCEFEVGLTVEAAGIEVDALTGELVGE